MTHDAPDYEPLRRGAGQSLAATFVFTALVAVTLAADLGLKHWAFATVAGRPLRVRSDDNRQPSVYQLSETGDWVQLPRSDPQEPASAIPEHESRTVIGRLLDLRLTLNTGAVFGLGKGGRVVFIAVSVLAVVVIVLLYVRSRAGAWGLQMAYALILAGALGNLYDRYQYSAVRDMLHLFPTTLLWPWIFNLADAALMVGVAAVMLLSFRHSRDQNSEH